MQVPIFFGISNGYPSFLIRVSYSSTAAEVQIGPLATTQIPFSFCPPTMTQHTAEIALSATRYKFRNPFKPPVELNTHIKYYQVI